MQGPYAPELVPWLRRHARIVRRRRVHHVPLLDDVGRAARVRGRGAHAAAPDRARRAAAAAVDLRGGAARARRVRVPHARRRPISCASGSRARRRARSSASGSRWTSPATPTRSGAGSGSARRPYLLYVGRVDPAKGASELIDYFIAYKQRNPSDLRLVLLGELLVDDPGRVRHRRHRLRRRADAQRRARRCAGARAPVVLRELRDGADRGVRAAPARARAAAVRGARRSRAPQRRRASRTAASPSSRPRSSCCTRRPSSPTRWARPAGATSSASTTGTS